MLICYLILINALSFVLMLADKHRAQKKRWRIPEAVLLITAIMGGSAGALVGMRLARHKTRKPLFALGIPLLLACHILLAIVVQI